MIMKLNDHGRNWQLPIKITCLFCGAEHTMTLSEVYYIETNKKSIKCAGGGPKNTICDNWLIKNGDMVQDNIRQGIKEGKYGNNS